MTDILKTITDPNIVGEALREFCFTKGKGYGCYENFDIEPIFHDLSTNQYDWKILHKTTLDKIGCSEDDRPQGFWRAKLDILIIWFWDGYGTLYFNWDGKELINADCKKSHNWCWL